MDEARAEDAADGAGPIQSRRARLPVGVVVRRTPGRSAGTDHGGASRRCVGPHHCPLAP